jgi:hypothetical protein
MVPDSELSDAIRQGDLAQLQILLKERQFKLADIVWKVFTALNLCRIDANTISNTRFDVAIGDWLYCTACGCVGGAVAIAGLLSATRRQRLHQRQGAAKKTLCGD